MSVEEAGAGVPAAAFIPPPGKAVRPAYFAIRPAFARCTPFCLKTVAENSPNSF